MKSKSNIMTAMKTFASVTFLFVWVAITMAAAPAAKEENAPDTKAKQEQFDTPQQALDTLVQAASTFDTATLMQVLGADATDLVSSDDPVMDKQHAIEFANKAKEKNAVEVDKKNSNRATLTVGNDDFPIPIPLVKQHGKWAFDTKAGRQEILNRRIGTNELDAIQICRGFVDAQHEYSEEKHDDSKVNQYAQKIISTPGKHDGLAWKNDDGTWGGPVGEKIANAIEQGYSKQGQPYHGYFFKVLKGQGPAADHGEMDFVVEGAMIGGFALAAAPAQYRVTGVTTFIVGPDGRVYQKDMGPDTLKTFQDMEKYNPDKSWHETEDEWEGSDEGDDSDANTNPQ